jgi:hypothetical protein
MEWRPQAPPKHPQSVEGTAPAPPARIEEDSSEADRCRKRAASNSTTSRSSVPSILANSRETAKPDSARTAETSCEVGESRTRVPKG